MSENAWEAKLRDVQLQGKAKEHGVRQAAMPDVKYRAGHELSLNDQGELIAKGANDEVADIDGWFKARKADCPHWFEPASGAGVDNHSHGPSGGTVRLTAAQAMDPRRYRAAKAEAERLGIPLQIIG